MVYHRWIITVESPIGTLKRLAYISPAKAEAAARLYRRKGWKVSEPQRVQVA